MNPVFWQIGNFTIHWYGVMMALALLSAVVVWHVLGKRERKYPGFGADVGVWLMVSGLVGARAAFVIANYENVYQYNFAEIFRIDQGGLIFYGGVIGSCIGMTIFAIWKHEPKAPLADLVVAPIPIAHAIGRVGCFLNGCCHGTEYSGPFHVRMHDMDVHPVQLYEAGLNSLLFLGLLYIYKKRSSPGQVFAAYLMVYGVIRFVVENFRGDERDMIGGMTTAQGVSVALFAAGLVLLIRTFVNPSPPLPAAGDAEQ